MRKTWLRVAVVFHRTRQYLRGITRETWLRIVVVLHRTRGYLRRTVGKTSFKVAVILALILSPIGIGWIYQRMTAFPKEITIAAGPKGDLYHSLSKALRKEIIKDNPEVEVHIVETKGSLENLLRLRAGMADFAMYQPSTFEVLSERRPDIVKETEERVAAAEAPLPPRPRGAEEIRFVANLYSMPAHFIVRCDAHIKNPAHLNGKTVSYGVNAMSLVLRQHFGLQKELDEDVPIDQIEQAFRNGTLDAAFITVGVQSPVFENLFDRGKCDLLPIPHAQAIAKNHISMSYYPIPKGFYGAQSSIVPSNKVETVALAAQLLTRSDVHAGFVEEVTRIVLSQEFLKDNQLEELFDDQDSKFARKKPHFATHAGALNFYEPELKPLLPSEFVGSMEAMRQFAGSLLIAAFFALRWLKQRRLKKKEHKLDRFIRKLLDIEQEQVALGTSGRADDVERLQKLVAAVTSLSQDALREFSARELNEDRAPEYFIDMAHDLNSKIDAKISRQRLDKQFAELADAISGRNGLTPERKRGPNDLSP